MNDLDTIEALAPDIRDACAAVITRYPVVMDLEQLVADVSLVILDEGIGDAFLDFEHVGDRVWWLMGVAARVVRAELAEYDSHREANHGR